jgi:two-component system CheB/CheR fusion protein
MEVLQFRGRTGPYLEHAHGEATLNLLKMAREGLVVSLRAALARAMKQNARVREEGLHLKQNGNMLEVNVDVVPFQVPPSREQFFLILFETPAPPVTEAAGRKIQARKERAFKSAESAELIRLREELASTRESLQAIIEEQEATNEELRSANEEIMSSNEELQSTNEELETAKEELQSTNEELTTLNDELESRNVELEQVNNDLHNLLASINIPIIMVGPDLRIRRFTGVAEKLLNLIPGDVGRPLTDINLHVDVPNPAKLVTEVIDTLQTRELDVKDRDGHWWSVRIRPYKTTDNKIDGAVIALLDVDLLKTSAEQIRRGRALAEAVVNAVRRPLVVLDENLVVQQANEAFLRMFKTSADEILHHRIYEVNHGEWNNPKLRTLLEEVLPHNSACENFALENDFPKLGRKRVMINANRLACEEGRTQMILMSIEEVSDLPDKK